MFSIYESQEIRNLGLENRQRKVKAVNGNLNLPAMLGRIE